MWEGCRVGVQYNRIFSWRIYTWNQRRENASVHDHQHGHRDVTWKPAIYTKRQYVLLSDITTILFYFRQEKSEIYGWNISLSKLKIPGKVLKWLTTNSEYQVISSWIPLKTLGRLRAICLGGYSYHKPFFLDKIMWNIRFTSFREHDAESYPCRTHWQIF